MAKPEWGTKRTCPNCNVHFYDLRRNPIVCPKCNSTVELEALVKNQQKLVFERKIAKTSKETSQNKDDLSDVEEGEELISGIDEEDEMKTEEDDIKREEEEEEENTDNLMEDASDLGADDDDVAEVLGRLENERDL